MHKKIKQMTALMLVFIITFTGASAFTGTPTTQFDYILQKIEQTSLYTQDKQMSDAEVAEKNVYIEQHPDEFQSVVNDYLKTLDSHSMFLTKEEYEQGFSTLVQTTGIGITIRQLNGKNVIIDVEDSSPAQQAGIKAGDEIKMIDGVSVDSMDITQIASIIAGDLGTSVTLTVIRDGQTLEFTAVRQYIQKSYVSSYTIEDGIEYIRIGAMGSESDFDKFEKIWNGLSEKNTKAVILDLRSNGGGLVDVAWKIADTIIPTDNTYMGGIQWRDDNGGFQKYYTHGTGLKLDKICVLVDENTASAAELLTGVLKETGNAQVIGTTTYGKGQGQYHFDVLGGKYKLVVTCMEMNLPQSGCWEGKGITPDVLVSDNNVIDTALKQLPNMDMQTSIRYGEKSTQVQAVSGRLYLLGYLDNITNIFDTEMLDAVRKFQKDNGINPAIVAGQATLEKIQEKINQLKNVGESSSDPFLDKALEICKNAISTSVGYNQNTNNIAA